MKEVLLVSYDFPPLTSAGSIRMSKLAKFLPELGWRPVVLTGTAAYSPYQALTLGGASDLQIVRVPDSDPFKRFAGALGASAGTGREAGRGRAQWLKKLYGTLVPDRDWLWRRAACRAGSRILQERDIRAIFSTSPYITNHLIALRLKELAGLPWVAEFRDAWAHSRVAPPSVLWRAWRCRVENDICARSDHFVSVSEEYLTDFRRHHDLPVEKSTVIYNGFDPDDFIFPEESGSQPFRKFSIAHAGFLYSGARSPKPLLEALKSLSQSNRINLEQVSLEFYGPYDGEVDALVRESGLGENCVWHGSFGYQELLPLLSQVYLLLLITHQGSSPTMPSKLFDYIGCRRPILAIASDRSEVSQIILQTQTGFSVSHTDQRQLETSIFDLWKRWQAGDPAWTAPSPESLSAYQRSGQARMLARILDGLVERNPSSV